MSIRLNGATSGSIEIDVPAVAGTDTAITIPATSGGEFIVSDSAGHVGIGTNAPEQVLHLASTAATTLLQFNDSGSGGAAAQCRIGCEGNDFVVLNNTGSNAATERFKISSSGNVAIGNPTTASDKLHVEGGGIRIEEDNGATISYREASSGDAELVFRDAKAATDRVKIDSGGRLLVGPDPANTYTNARLQVSGSAGYSYISMLNTTASDGNGDRYSYLNFRGKQSGGEESNLARIGGRHDGTGDDQKGLLEFRTNDGNDNNSGQLRMEIDSSGYVYMKNMAVGGTANMHWSSSAGQLFVTSSSERFKHDITAYDKGLTELMQLEPKYFVYNDEPGQKQRAGFIAEDFHALGLTEYVEYWSDEDGNATVPSEIGYSNMVAILVKSIQEQQAMIETLEANNVSLEAKVTALETQNASFEARLAALEGGTTE